MCRQVNRGFTLIELLVVIAIIAQRARILFPVSAGSARKIVSRPPASATSANLCGVFRATPRIKTHETLPLPPNPEHLQTADMSIFHCPSSSNNATPV